MIIIIDYGMGNLHSVYKAFERLGSEVKISNNLEDIKKADKIILPGVGNFKKGMENLRKLNLIKPLNQRATEDKTPILGICLGMQLLTKHSEEGDCDGLGWFNAVTRKFNLRKEFKVPHMGWNSINIEKNDKIFEGIEPNSKFYFVHSFYVECLEEKDILAYTEHDKNFVSAIQKDNIYGMQFHPEKSHESGLKILKNFIEGI